MTSENPSDPTVGAPTEPGPASGSASGASSGTASGSESGHESHPGPDAPGSLSEEALKLAETLQQWLSTGAAMTGAGTSSECKVCPLCQAIGMVNGMRPEVLAHLAEAGTSLVAAFRSAVDSSERMWAGTKRPPVQHINVT